MEGMTKKREKGGVPTPILPLLLSLSFCFFSGIGCLSGDYKQLGGQRGW